MPKERTPREQMARRDVKARVWILKGWLKVADVLARFARQLRA
jgi:hypothetical protein